MVVKHQRLRMNEPEVVEARRLNKPLESELSIFLRHCPCLVVGVTDAWQEHHDHAYF